MHQQESIVLAQESNASVFSKGSASVNTTAATRDSSVSEFSYQIHLHDFQDISLVYLVGMTAALAGHFRRLGYYYEFGLLPDSPSVPGTIMAGVIRAPDSSYLQPTLSVIRNFFDREERTQKEVESLTEMMGRLSIN